MPRYQWNPWHGCHKCSPGCRNCYVFYCDGKRRKDANVVTRSKTNFNLPMKRTRAGGFKIPSGTELATGFTSDFFIEDADPWREEAWDIIRRRPDVKFLIPTKRPERVAEHLPRDWGNGWENIALAVTAECQEKADERLPILLGLPMKHKFVFVSPILEDMSLAPYLETGGIEQVSVGGESYEGARTCDFDWVRHIYADCKRFGVKFDFHQTGSNFVKDGKRYRIPHHDEYAQAKKGEAVLELEYEEEAH